MKTTAKIEKHEADCMKAMGNQATALVQAMGHIQAERKEWWKRIIEKYHLDPNEGYSLDEKTREVKAIGKYKVVP